MRPAKILIVTADLLCGRTLYRLLSRQGYQVETVQTERMALVTRSEFQPDLLVLDLELLQIACSELIQQRGPLVFVLDSLEHYPTLTDAINQGGMDGCNKFIIDHQEFLDRIQKLLSLLDPTTVGLPPQYAWVTNVMIDRVNQNVILSNGHTIALTAQGITLFDYLHTTGAMLQRSRQATEPSDPQERVDPYRLVLLTPEHDRLELDQVQKQAKLNGAPLPLSTIAFQLLLVHILTSDRSWHQQELFQLVHSVLQLR